MKKSLFVLLSVIITTSAFAKLDVIVSIVPLKIFVDKIGGDKVHSSVMVKQGSSPHNYEPKPSQMKNISKAQLYFSIGVEFEKVWLKKFKNQNRKLLISNVVYDLNKSSIKHHHHNDEEELDPHVWVDPINVKHIVNNVYKTLIQIDNNNSIYYKKNLDLYLEELTQLDKKIKNILKETPKHSSFMVFHPAWGYFAKRYELTQLPVEVEGKEPKMKALVKLMKQAKKENIHAIFTQPEFSDKSAKIIARNLNIEVIKTSPLTEKWSENLINLAKAIAQKER